MAKGRTDANDVYSPLGGVVLLVLSRIRHVGREEHLDVRRNLVNGRCHSLPTLLEVAETARVGAVREVPVDCGESGRHSVSLPSPSVDLQDED